MVAPRGPDSRIIVDVIGRAAIESVLEISAAEVAGPRQPGKRREEGGVGYHGRQAGRVYLSDRAVRVDKPRLRHSEEWEVARAGLPVDRAPPMRLWSLHPKYLDPKGLVALGQDREFEWRHLAGKLAARAPDWHREMVAARSRGLLVEPHSLFRVVPGGVAGWERGAGPLAANPRAQGRPSGT